jgi:hypothetical protein
MVKAPTELMMIAAILKVNEPPEAVMRGGRSVVAVKRKRMKKSEPRFSRTERRNNFAQLI